MVNAPANRFNPESAEQGGIEWASVFSSGAILAAAEGHIEQPWNRIDMIGAKADVHRGGFLTGTWKQGARPGGGQEFLFSAGPDAVVGVIANVILNRGKEDRDLNYDWIDRPVRDAKPVGGK